ncbi:MAG: DUF979 domain-containing protein [Pseudomonadota bacterium]|nr:DUF979 domain-containing protein [Pseudomonadota bacterium]
MLRLEYIYWLISAFLAVTAMINLRERRYGMSLFWAILAAAFLFGRQVIQLAEQGQRLPAQLMGVGVILLGVIASMRPHPAPVESGTRAERELGATRLGGRLFAAALVIPIATLVLVLSAPYLKLGSQLLIDPKHPSLIALGLACLLALVAAWVITGARPAQSLTEGRRLLDTLGWAVLLPMVLSTLGGVFTATGVGDSVSVLLGSVIATDSRVACVIAYGLGMVLFTVVMGNAFAAFPVITAGIGLPFLVIQHGADPAIVGAMGMLTGYCGTLLTPMAANFNIVPAVLLELPDQYAVIRAQWPTAIALMACNFLLMYWLVFR